MAGRRSKYTPETVEKITQAIRLGATYELAASYAGISHTTFFEWMNTKPEFVEQVKAAEGAGAMQWLAKIEKAATEGNWQAAAWKLERRYPERYGRTVVDTRNYDVSKMSDDDLAKLARGEKP